jgi:hypothetical protein
MKAELKEVFRGKVAIKTAYELPRYRRSVWLISEERPPCSCGSCRNYQRTAKSKSIPFGQKNTVDRDDASKIGL